MNNLRALITILTILVAMGFAPNALSAPQKSKIANHTSTVTIKLPPKAKSRWQLKPVFGVNFTSISGAGRPFDIDFRTGIVAGASLEFTLSRSWGLEIGGQYRQAGAIHVDATDSSSGAFGDFDEKIHYAYIPVGLKFYPVNARSGAISIYAGAAPGFMISARRSLDLESSQSSSDVTAKYTDFDLRLEASVAGRIHITDKVHAEIAGKFSHGIFDISESAAIDDQYNIEFGATAGLNFLF